MSPRLRRMTGMTTDLDFKCAWSGADDTRAALAEVCERIAQPRPSCVCFYCSPRYDLEELARGIRGIYDCPVLACTTAGEVVPGLGYVERGLAAASLQSPRIKVVQEVIPDVRRFDTGAALQLQRRLVERLGGACPPDEKRFAMLLIDGLCEREEFVAAAIYGALNGVPLIGGSAGEAGALVETRVFAEDAFRTHAATVTMLQTSLPAVVFKTDHFEPRDPRFVITRADPQHRRLLEINGIAPVDFYVEQTGIEQADFDAIHASRHPLLLPVGADHYARGVRATEADGTLAMFCAIEEGIVMRLGHPTDIVANLRRQQRALADMLPGHVVTLGFDCFYRKMEVLDRQLKDAVRPVVDDLNLFAFNTYGEQFNGIHVNQTLTGIALGVPV